MYRGYFIPWRDDTEEGDREQGAGVGRSAGATSRVMLSHGAVFFLLAPDTGFIADTRFRLTSDTCRLTP
jgi:hypothetical protein